MIFATELKIAYATERAIFLRNKLKAICKDIEETAKYGGNHTTWTQCDKIEKEIVTALKEHGYKVTTKYIPCSMNNVLFIRW